MSVWLGWEHKLMDTFDGQTELLIFHDKASFFLDVRAAV